MINSQVRFMRFKKRFSITGALIYGNVIEDDRVGRS